MDDSEDRKTQVRRSSRETYGEDFPSHLRVRLAVTSGQDRGKKFEVQSTPVFLGRFSLEDFPLTDPSVSRTHAVLYYEGGRFRVKDMGSTNGTFVNGVEVTESPLRNRDLLALGEVTLQFLVEER